MASAGPPTLASARTSTPAATPAEAPVAFLYVQVAEAGTFRPADGPDLYDLELLHAGGTTLAFADRPARAVRLLPTDEALAAIGFAPVPPNAALVTGPANGEMVVVLELLEGRFATETGTLTYRVRALAEADREPLLGAIEERAVVAPPASFAAANLFIDDVALCEAETCAAGPGSSLCDVALSYDPSTQLPSLAGLDLSSCDLSNADLRGANLEKAYLVGAYLPGAGLRGANLSGAVLNYANLNSATLSSASLAGASMFGADLAYADLTGADLSGAILDQAIWADTTCPDGTNSNAGWGGTCLEHL